MKLKVNFISKITKALTLNEIVFVKGKNTKSNILKSNIKSVLDNQLFKDQLFIQKEYKGANYILVNCKKLLMSSDFENSYLWCRVKIHLASCQHHYLCRKRLAFQAFHYYEI